MKPIIILPPNMMSEANIKALRGNDICVVVAKDPSKVRFVDPIPAASNRTQIEDACIKLSRILLNGQWGDTYNQAELGRAQFSTLYLKCLMTGTPLDSRGTREEQREYIIASEKAEEFRRIAREEARAERAAKKAQEEAKEKKTAQEAAA